ncbi:unnamed protein product [Medioppia subpectinata]|uniref:Uncharacterized protein n=1 Tax=Medioppia subpectinata TaxID=1979941 RepID=A0A7R9KSP0_9ACAR|nr:unnamed protein product [Medioppia subpectinata]CAG2109071.1 unnamed protein product [Medioppia subpectinata]
MFVSVNPREAMVCPPARPPSLFMWWWTPPLLRLFRVVRGARLSTTGVVGLGYPFSGCLQSLEALDCWPEVLCPAISSQRRSTTGSHNLADLFIDPSVRTPGLRYPSLYVLRCSVRDLNSKSKCGTNGCARLPLCDIHPNGSRDQSIEVSVPVSLHLLANHRPRPVRGLGLPLGVGIVTTRHLTAAIPVPGPVGDPGQPRGVGLVASCRPRLFLWPIVSCIPSYVSSLCLFVDISRTVGLVSEHPFRPNPVLCLLKCGTSLLSKDVGIHHNTWVEKRSDSHRRLREKELNPLALKRFDDTNDRISLSTNEFVRISDRNKIYGGIGTIDGSVWIIITKVSTNEFVRISDRNKIYGGIGTIDGSVWIVYNNRKVFKRPIIGRDNDVVIPQPSVALTQLNRGPTVFKRPIIGRDNNVVIPQPSVALTQLNRGPTGAHDLFITGSATLCLLYCHQTVCTLNGGERVASLCGRTYVMKSDIVCDLDNDSGDDDSLEYELKTGQHLRIISGTVRVKVSAAGHRVFVGAGTQSKQSVKYEIFS